MALLLSSFAYIYIFFIYKFFNLNRETISVVNQFDEKKSAKSAIKLYIFTIVNVLICAVGGYFYRVLIRNAKTFTLFSSHIIAIGLCFALESTYRDNYESWFARIIAFFVGFLTRHDIEMFFFCHHNAFAKRLFNTCWVFVFIIFLSGFVFPADYESLQILLLSVFSFFFFTFCELSLQHLIIVKIRNYNIVAIFHVLTAVLTALAITAPFWYCFMCGVLLFCFIITIECSTIVLRYSHYPCFLLLLQVAISCIIAYDARKITKEIDQWDRLNAIRIFLLCAKFDLLLETNLFFSMYSARSL